MHSHFLARSTRLALATLITITGVSSFGSQRMAAPQVRPATAAHLQNTLESNRELLGWLTDKKTNLGNWLTQKGQKDGPPDFIDFYLPPSPLGLSPLTTLEEQRAAATKELYNQYFPPNDPSSYVGSFFESGHPYVETRRGPYQWDSMEASGMNTILTRQDCVDSRTRFRGANHCAQSKEPL